MSEKKTPFDSKEYEKPETLFVRDIENEVFQGIVVNVLSEINGVTLLEGTFIDHLLKRDPAKTIKGIIATQDSKNHSVAIKIEINIFFGVLIPAKAEEIQLKVTEEITKLTGLHVSSVHVVFKKIVKPLQKEIDHPQDTL
jgi:uncharacterized alkaline shock family protein YloU